MLDTGQYAIEENSDCSKDRRAPQGSREMVGQQKYRNSKIDRENSIDRKKCSNNTVGPQAKIYAPSWSTMQSGGRHRKYWVLEYEPRAASFIEPLMGWTGSRDTMQQVKLRFESEDQAVQFAKRDKLHYRVYGN